MAWRLGRIFTPGRSLRRMLRVIALHLSGLSKPDRSAPRCQWTRTGTTEPTLSSLHFRKQCQLRFRANLTSANIERWRTLPAFNGQHCHKHPITTTTTTTTTRSGSRSDQDGMVEACRRAAARLLLGQRPGSLGGFRVQCRYGMPSRTSPFYEAPIEGRVRLGLMAHRAADGHRRAFCSRTHARTTAPHVGSRVAWQC